MLYFILISIVMLNFQHFCTYAGQGEGSPQYKLYKKLMNGYLNIRPVKNWSTDMHVDVHFKLIQIKELKWQDDFLQWNSTEYGIKELLLPARQVWTPYFVILNSAYGLRIDPTWKKDLQVIARPDGQIIWYPGGLIHTSCSMSMRLFPFDTQNCSIILSNSLEPLTLTSKIKDIGKALYIENSEWYLKDSSLTSGKLKLTDGIRVSIIHATLILARNYQNYLTSVIIPVFLLSLVGSMIFALPPDSGDKMSFGVTIMLGFSVFQMIISDQLPQSSLDSPIIMKVVATFMCFNGISLFLAAFILTLHHMQSVPELPHWLRYLLFHILGKVVCKKMSRGNTSLLVATQSPGSVYNVSHISGNLDDNDSQVPKDSLKLLIQISSIRQLLEKMITRLELKEEEAGNLDDWKKAAIILDRILFLGSILVFICVISSYIFLIRCAD